MTKIFNVASRTQAVIFECELKGQISDGNWENSVPMKHWMAPCEATVIVNPSNIGRNFRAMRTYAFAGAWLVNPKSENFVADCHNRSIAYAKFSMLFPNISIKDIHSFAYLIDSDRMWDYDNDHYRQKQARFASVTGIISYDELKSKLDAVTYTAKNFHADLTALSKAYRIEIR